MTADGDLTLGTPQDHEENDETNEAASLSTNDVLEPAFRQNPLVDNDYVFGQAMGRYWYMGPASSWAFCRRVLALVGKHLPEANNEPLPWHLDGVAFRLQWRPLMPDEPPDISNLPPSDYAYFLIQTARFYLGPLASLIDEAEFLQHFKELYQDASAKAASCKLWYAQYLLMIAFGKAFLGGKSADGSPPGYQYAARAMPLMPELAGIALDPVLSAQALTLAAIYFQSIDMRVAAYQHIGQALRICVLSGFHRHMPEEAVGAQHSKRCHIVFWVVYMLDQEFAALIGATSAIRDEDITNKLPSQADSSLSSLSLTLHVQLARLIARLLGTVYGVGKDYDGTLFSNTQSILRHLAELNRDLNNIINNHFRDSISKASRIATRLLLQYHHCVVLTTRPQIMCALHMHIEQSKTQLLTHGLSLSPPVASLIQSCVSSAQAILKTLRALADEDLIEAFLPFQIEYASSSAFLLHLIPIICPSLLSDDSWRDDARYVFDTLIAKGSLIAPLRKVELEQLEQKLAALTPASNIATPEEPDQVEEHVSVQEEENGEPELDEHVSDETGWDLFAANAMAGLTPGELLDLAEQLDLKDNPMAFPAVSAEARVPSPPPLRLGHGKGRPYDVPPPHAPNQQYAVIPETSYNNKFMPYPYDYNVVPPLSPPTPKAALSPSPRLLQNQQAASSFSELSYQYRPIEDASIRLVRILPERKTMIKCEIIHVSLEQPPPYKAISYTWGDTGDTRKIEIEGCLIPIAVSLHGHLQALRKKQSSVLVWADALCINQKDRDERSQQVQLMPFIYSNADSVAIWLGPEENDSARAASFLDAIATTGEPFGSSNISKLLAAGAENGDLLAVVSLFGREYWRRLWVVQEVFNAKRIMVHCGSTRLEWKKYQSASVLFSQRRGELIFNNKDQLKRRLATSPDQFSYVQTLIYQGPASLPDLKFHMSDGEEALLQVLRTCRRKLASDPRDKLYGILGVLPASIRDEFRADYNLSVKDVYTEIVDFLLKTTEKLDIICEAIHFPVHTSTANLPTFVPDWSHIPQTSAMGFKYNFSASGSSKAVCRFRDERLNKLEISGLEIDVVQSKGVVVGTLCNLGDYLMAFLHWRALLLQAVEGRNEQELQMAEECFAATICLGQIPSEYDRGRWQAEIYHVFANLFRDRLPYIRLDDRLAYYLETPSGIGLEDAEACSNLILGIDKPSFLRVFAILVIVERSGDIRAFIDADLHDERFPLVQGSEHYLIAQICMAKLGWSYMQKDYFNINQLRISPRVFALGEDYEAQHYEMPKGQMLPWVLCRDSYGVHEETLSGGCGQVVKYKIDSNSHGFAPLLEKLGFYSSFVAVKSLKNTKNEKGTSNKELEMLQRFSGLSHPNIITLLATYTLNDRFHFIFPAAEYDLLMYWKIHPGPLVNPASANSEGLLWLSGQIRNIVGALAHIHEGRKANMDTETMFGRHGDIKPANILWFRSRKERRGVFVISDFGIADAHREETRSIIPAADLPVTPRYRAAECDIRDGRISRAYDVWSLGCVLLEMISWILGANELRERFKEILFSPYITGVKTDIYYDFHWLGPGEGYRAGIKEQIVQASIEKMRFSHYFVAFALALSGAEALTINSDSCLKAVTAVSSKTYASDCKAYLYTTVTPKKVTIYRTKTVTSIPTVRKSVTAISTQRVTATRTNSVVKSVTIDITTTVTMDGTKTVTQQTTKTITTTAQNVSPPFKKRAANAPVIPPYASSACSNSAKYSSACSRVGVTSKTITLPRTTIVSVIHKVIIPRRTTIKTAIATAYATKTVKTEVVQETYSTERISKVVGTEVKDNIIATETKTEISTKTEAADPLQTIVLIAHNSGDPNLAPLGGVGFTHLENQIGTGKYFFDFTTDVDSDVTFTLNERTGEIKVANGPGNSIGKAGYSNVNGNSDNYVRFMSAEEATANAANRFICKIVPATSYPLGLQCLWGTNQIADFWTCSSRLVLVQPGLDFTSQCTGASTSYSIDIEVRLA
ncbi:heterokaryon incompatibility protein het-6 [Fusarium sp. NRRL 25303]|nr:heterokaryon incompatibility protein het-6 [Fusarium sp. NRRL 25303]